MPSLDENPNCESTYASFRLRGDRLQPSDVEAALGLQGDFGAAKDEIRRAPGSAHRTVRQPSGVWFLTTKDRLASTNVERHLLHLLEQLEPVSERLTELIEETAATADFYCYWLSASGQGGPEISAETLGRIAALPAQLGFEFHGPWHGEID